MLKEGDTKYDPILGEYVVLYVFNDVVFGFYLNTRQTATYRASIVEGWRDI